MGRASGKYDDIGSIVCGCTSGDRAAQRALYEMYARKMAAVCMRYVADRETALDLMHDGFILLFFYIHERLDVSVVSFRYESCRTGRGFLSEPGTEFWIVYFQ